MVLYDENEVLPVSQQFETQRSLWPQSWKPRERKIEIYINFPYDMTELLTRIVEFPQNVSQAKKVNAGKENLTLTPELRLGDCIQTVQRNMKAAIK